MLGKTSMSLNSFLFCADNSIVLGGALTFRLCSIADLHEPVSNQNSTIMMSRKRTRSRSEDNVTTTTYVQNLTNVSNYLFLIKGDLSYGKGL